MQADIIVVGGGAAGLAASHELSLVNRKVILLEAQERLGGRIHSVIDEGFSQVIETGAEFIHGKLPLTTRLLKKAGIKYHEAEGKMWRVKKGEIEKSDEFIEGWDEVMGRLKDLKEDITIEGFLNNYFAGEEYIELRESVLRYAEGYDAADASRASAISLREEWENDDDEHQGRIDNGYAELINFLAGECSKKGCEIHLTQVAKKINWQKNNVDVITSGGSSFSAQKLLFTIPLGIWQAPQEHAASISFFPELKEKKEAAQKMGYGTVIKFHFQFSEPFWENSVPNKMKNAGFILSDAEIPTWWTQSPRRNNLLTGWLAGPKALSLKYSDEEELFQIGLRSLAYIFGTTTSFVQEKIILYKVSNWSNNPFSLGAYSYATVDTPEARKTLGKPVENTLYFAGEALYDGTETGTVEGALVSGTDAARQIIASER